MTKFEGEQPGVSTEQSSRRELAQPRVHLSYLDGLRGWASLFVLMHHLWQFVVLQADRPPPPRWFAVMTIFKYGPFAVTLFIVLSGYSLMIPVARSIDASLAGGRRGFFVRRGRRILPAYYAAMLFSLALLLAFPAMAHPSGTQWDTALPVFDVEYLLLHVALLHNLFDPAKWALDPPLWSVALEWQIYWVFALMLLPIWRRKGALMTLLAAVVLAALPIALGFGHLHSWYVVSFALGMWGASINFSKPAWAERTPWGLVSLAFLAPAGIWLGVFKARVGDEWVAFGHVFSHLCLSVAAGAFLVRCTRGLLAERTSLIVRALSHRWSVNLGHFSYSLYLLHYPILGAICIALRRYNLPGLTLFLVLLACVPPILGVSYVFHLFFEKPHVSSRNSGKARVPAVAA